MIILFADDDRLVRFSLKSMLLDWVKDDCMIIEAKNGKELVEKCVTYKPNIALVDIDMPYLDGISAIEQCQSQSPLTQFAILSGHSDFSYAQKCMSLNISDYTLKPIESKQFYDLLEKLNNRLANAYELENSNFQIKLINLFHMLDEVGFSQEDILETQSDDIFYYGFVFFIDCEDDSKTYADIYRSLLCKINVIGANAVKSNQKYVSLSSSEGALRVVFSANKPDDNKWVICQLQQICQELTNNKQSVSGFYITAQSLYELYKGFEQISDMQYLSFGYPLSNLAPLPEKSSLDDLTVNFLEKMQYLFDAYNTINDLRYTSILNNIYRKFLGTKLSVNLKNVVGHIEIITGYKINSGNFKEFCHSLIDMNLGMYNKTKPKGNSKIDQIVEYVEQNYMNDISINALAERFELTPNYLSKLFHDKVETKFIDYLADLRVSNAKRILVQNNDTAIKDVALMVGYYSSRYFSNVFKKETGLYPSEFRKKYHQ